MPVGGVYKPPSMYNNCTKYIVGVRVAVDLGPTNFSIPILISYIFSKASRRTLRSYPPGSGRSDIVGPRALNGAYKRSSDTTTAAARSSATIYIIIIREWTAGSWSDPMARAFLGQGNDRRRVCRIYGRGARVKRVCCAGVPTPIYYNVYNIYSVQEK